MMKAGSMMVSRAGSRLVRRRCACCGDELDAHRALSAGVCDRARCREWKIDQVGAELLERRRREVRERLFDEAAPAVEAAAAAIAADRADIVRASVPWQGAPVEPLPDERRASFASHLRWIVEEAFASPLPEADEADEANGAARAAGEKAEAPVLAAACALCRGKCCDRGGRTGMLDEDDIRRWRRRRPADAPEIIVASYTALVPDRTVEGSCVFLGAEGCALPREMRNDWCNLSQCRERANLEGALADATGADRGPGAVPAVVIVADDAGRDCAAAVGGWSPATGLVRIAVERDGSAPGEAPQAENPPVGTLQVETPQAEAGMAGGDS